ncbi:MAG: cell surface protein SprA [Bacteroidetes bacterium]|nr:cell surface protein SprA [Bacteroidota bacterium]
MKAFSFIEKCIFYTFAIIIFSFSSIAWRSGSSFNNSDFLVDSLLTSSPADTLLRYNQFKYKRNSSQTALITNEDKYSFFLEAPSFIQKTIEIDSTGKFVIVRELVDGKDVKIPYQLTLDDFIKLRLRDGIYNLYKNLISLQESSKKKGDALSQLMGSFTNIDIPIPANPVFSIFGPPRISLQISGAVDIRAGFRNTKTEQSTISRLGSERNEPDFSQNVQINVSGMIGDKLNILADWNTQRTFEYENQLRIKYTGYEDEIIQSVEAGNVSLPTNSSFISSSSALFGIKTAMQIGPLKLTAVASQKKGQIQEKSISGGSQEVPFEKRTWEYSRDHFFVDTSYIKYFTPFYTSLQGNSAVQIIDAEIWITHIGPNDPNERKGNAFLNLPAYEPILKNYDPLRNANKTIPGEVEIGSWDKLDKKDYVIHEYTGFITFNKSIQDGQAIAIAYRVANGQGPNDDIFYGDFTNTLQQGDSVLVLKLIKPRNLIPQFSIPWRMMLKNIYSLGGRNVSKTGFELQIFYQLPAKEAITEIGGVKLLSLFGFDNINDVGAKTPDNVFDYNPPFTIDEVRGEIIFPQIRPFDDGITEYFQKNGITIPADSFTFKKLYDTTQLAAQYETSRDRFIIKGKTKAGSSNAINLGFNVVEGSVQVLLNGQPLVINVDYTVDYIVGQILIKNQAALVPGANLQVKFEQNDLFQLASKTLLGLRGETNLTEKSNIGFTLMTLDEQTLSDKVRLNEEPIRNTIMGFDFSTSGTVNFLTDVVNFLPGISTNANSDFTLRGEAAYMSPDPNTKKSTIEIDNAKGIAYIDDFEGSKRTIPLGVGYGLWRDMSPPSINIADTTLIKSKAKMFWYNILPSDISVNEIWGDKKYVARGQEQVTALSLRYDPKKRGAYNFSNDLQKTLLDDPQKNWAGVQRMVSSSVIDLARENINFIEVWVKIYEGYEVGKTKVYLDLGMINEDIIPNKLYNTEDQGVFKNGILNDGEDTGIDGLTNDAEKNYYSSFVNANKNLFSEIVEDPSGDDWQFSSSFELINGTENNGSSEIGRFPDTEDFNRNNILDQTDSYFTYELNLDTSASNLQRAGAGNNGWYQYRIPINEFSNKVGKPDLSIIETIRLWVTGASKVLDIRLVDFNLVGNQWEELVKNDSTFQVSTVNFEDNPEYTIPPGVKRARDRTIVDQEVYGNEQSLSLNIKNLRDNETRFAIKRFSYRPLDVFSYRELRMFVHGQEIDKGALKRFSNDPNNADAEIIVRFGADSLNYYEYRAPVLPGWSEQNNVSIKFSELTAIKQVRDSVNEVVSINVPNGPTNSRYIIKGNPTLTRILFISIGVYNPQNKGVAQLNGEIWVNELRLTDVDDTPGWAYSVTSTLKIADIGSLSFNYSEVDPFFHALQARFGSRTTNKSWNASAAFSLEKFLPESWNGSSFPFSYSHSEALVKPKYIPSSDIDIGEAAKQIYENKKSKTGSEDSAQVAKEKFLIESQTLQISDSYALPNFKINLPGDLWIVKKVINQVSYGFTYNTNSMRSPTIQNKSSWGWNSRVAYIYSLSPENYFEPFKLDWFDYFESIRDFKIFFPVTSYNFGLNLARSQTKEDLRNQLKPIDPTRNFSASRNLAFSWKLTENGFLNLSGDYGLDIGSTLVHLETDTLKKQRNFSDILRDLIGREQLISFGQDNTYSQNFNVNTIPRVPSIFNVNKYVTMALRYGVSYRWANNLQQGDLGKGAGWGNSISLNSDISLKAMVESWIGASTVDKPSEKIPPRSRFDEDEVDKNELRSIEKVKEDTTSKTKTEFRASNQFKNIFKNFIKTPLLDFDRISFSWTQTNSSQNNGIPGRPGFKNLLGTLPFEEYDQHFGPSRLYQLGLVSEPTSDIVGIESKNSFPFFKFKIESGFRAKNANINDAFTQSNKVQIRTNRNLWEGARIDLNWNIGIDYSRNQSLKTDEFGVPTIVSSISGGGIERSFLTFPILNNIQKVSELYNKLKSDDSDKRPNDEKFSEAFEDGLETFSFIRKAFGQYTPQLNYSFSWDGLEKITLLKNYFNRVSLEHTYNSSYRKALRGNPSGGTLVESQRINYSFAPLLGMNVTFKEIFKGNINSNIRFSTNSSYDLIPTSKNISENSSTEISITGGFSRTGFEIPVFGLALSNDIDLSFSYSFSKNNRQTFSSENLGGSGTPGEGSSRTTFEPRIRYILSSRVTASVFYKYTKLAPDAGGSRIPGSTTNEGGFDVHISIQ